MPKMCVTVYKLENKVKLLLKKVKESWKEKQTNRKAELEKERKN